MSVNVLKLIHSVSQYLLSSPSSLYLGYRYVVLDVPLLFETRRLTQFLNHTVVVYW